jgi:hypothetical protein
MPSSTPARLWHGVVATAVLAALVLQVVIAVKAPGSPPAHAVGTLAGAPVAGRLLRVASFFTIQSNVLVAVTSAQLSLSPARDGRVWRILRLDALVGIAVTGVVYATVLARIPRTQGLGAGRLQRDLSLRRSHRSGRRLADRRPAPADRPPSGRSSTAVAVAVVRVHTREGQTFALVPISLRRRCDSRVPARHLQRAARSARPGRGGRHLPPRRQAIAPGATTGMRFEPSQYSARME